MISFLGSPKNSIFYSIARFFIRQQYCAATKIQWQRASRAQNRLQIIWISIEAHATLHWIPIWRPVSTVDTLYISLHRTDITTVGCTWGHQWSTPCKTVSLFLKMHFTKHAKGGGTFFGECMHMQSNIIRKVKNLCCVEISKLSRNKDIPCPILPIIGWYCSPDHQCPIGAEIHLDLTLTANLAKSFTV